MFNGSINSRRAVGRVREHEVYILFDIFRQVALHISSRSHRRSEAAGALKAAARIYVKPVACFTRNGNDESFRALRRDRAALHPLIYRRKAASDSHGGYREPIFRKPAPNPKERDIYRADLKYKVASGMWGYGGCPRGADLFLFSKRPLRL